MTRSRFPLLSVCILALGLLAFASSAQAAKWSVSGTDAKELKTLVNAELGLLVLDEDPEGKKTLLEVASVGHLLTTVLGKKIDISCTGLTLLGVNLEGEGKVTEGSKAQFTGCVTKIESVEQPACKPKSGGGALGTIITNEVKGVLKLHTGGVAIIEFLPKTGETFVTFELGEKCSIGETLPIRGKVFIKSTVEGTSVDKAALSHFFQEGPLTELWVLNKTVEHTATLDGAGKATLAGAHASLSWNGNPE
jgi:hypothetical protein